jgi:hypothetical protein
MVIMHTIRPQGFFAKNAVKDAAKASSRPFVSKI